MDPEDLGRLDVAEHGDFLHGGGEELVFASTGDLKGSSGRRERALILNQATDMTHDIGQETQPPQIPHSGLGRLGLLLPADDGNQTDINQSEILHPDAELELPHGLDKGRGFDIPDGTA